jgi:hypothetical protein
MRTHSHVWQEVTHGHFEGWQHIRSWAESSLEKEKIAEIVLVISTLVLLGVIFFSVHQALQNLTMTEPAYFSMPGPVHF